MGNLTVQLKNTLLQRNLGMVNFVVQAKHTSSPTAPCSDRDFEAIIKKKYPKSKNQKVMVK
jgi:hypothetical protein